MYSAMLAVHSWMRWVTLVLAVVATINALRPASDVKRLPGRGWDTLFMAAVDLQFLFGLILYFGLSPFTKEALSDLGAAMKNPGLRFWAVEHAFGMLLVVVLVRMGRVMSTNAKSAAPARRRRLICFALGTLVMIGSIPWPGMANGRPLFRV
jgi:hypothetical protein